MRTGRGWQFDANDEFHMELWGNHARIRPAGEMYATFHDGDEYCWAPVRAHRRPAAQTLPPRLLPGHRACPALRAPNCTPEEA